VKNTLMQRAVAESGRDDLAALIAGPSAVAFVAGDPVAAAKTVVDAAKKYPTLVLKGGYLDGKVLSADEARSLAELEPRDVMLSKVAGLVKNEISRAAAVLVSAQAKFLSLLEAFKEKVPGDEGLVAGADSQGSEDTGSEDSGSEDTDTEDTDTEDTGSEDTGSEDTGSEDSNEDEKE
jgi:large subunit ribosomal protein L10